MWVDLASIRLIDNSAQKQLAEENLETLSYIMMHRGKTTNETNATKLKRKKT